MTSYFVALHTEQRIPIVGDCVHIGRMPHDQQRQHAVGALAWCEGDWIYFPYMAMSRRHASLTRLGDGEYTIEDAGSQSGTYVNGLQIKEPVRLSDGDTLHIGTVKLMYRTEA